MKYAFKYLPVIVPLLSVLIWPLLIFKLNILDLVGPLCWGMLTGNNKLAMCFGG